MFQSPTKTVNRLATIVSEMEEELIFDYGTDSQFIGRLMEYRQAIAKLEEAIHKNMGE